MNDSGKKERVFVARCAFVLFVAGLLVPFLIATAILAASPRGRYAERPATLFPLGFGFTAEVLALRWGLIGRRRLSGRIAMMGAITVFLLALVVAGGMFLSLCLRGNQAWLQGGPR